MRYNWKLQQYTDDAGIPYAEGGQELAKIGVKEFWIKRPKLFKYTVFPIVIFMVLIAIPIWFIPKGAIQAAKKAYSDISREIGTIYKVWRKI